MWSTVHQKSCFFPDGPTLLVVLQSVLKGKTETLSSPILMWYWKGKEYSTFIISEMKIGRGARWHWKRIVWFSLVYQAWFVLLLAGFVQAFSLQVYKNYDQDLGIRFAPGKKVKSKAGLHLYFCLAEVIHILCQSVHVGEREE